MMRDESEEYGEQGREAIEGLRRLARRVETPPDLGPEILARVEQLLPPHKARRARWWTVMAAWRPHPLAWGPVVAVACFAAGMLVPWPRVSMPPEEAISEKRSTPAAQSSPRESVESLPASPAMPSQPPRQEMGPQTESAPAPPDPLTAVARRRLRQTSSSPPIQVTATLPAALYEQLQHEAQRRQISVAALLREAVEAYAESQKGEK
jgi:Ribbon-helix-helix protein, copG family